MNPTRRRTYIVIATLCIMAVVAAIAWLGFVASGLDARLQQESAARLTSDRDRSSLADDVRALRGQVLDAGETPVAPEPSVPTSPALTDAQVRALAGDVVNELGATPAAVSALIDAAVARVEATPGPPPSPATVRAATQKVTTAYLKANPPPAGQDGRDGRDGTNGADSTVPGAQGEKGDTGAAGVGVASARFDTDSCSIVQTLTDGTEQSFGPLCGDDGEDGEDAVPFTFRFTVPGPGGSPGTTYECTIPSAGADPQDCAPIP